MKTVQVTVTDMDGRAVPAQKLLCIECGGESFVIFVIGERHYHLQCINCDESFCDGSCGEA